MTRKQLSCHLTLLPPTEKEYLRGKRQNVVSTMWHFSSTRRVWGLQSWARDNTAATTWPCFQATKVFVIAVLLYLLWLKLDYVVALWLSRFYKIVACPILGASQSFLSFVVFYSSHQYNRRENYGAHVKYLVWPYSLLPIKWATQSSPVLYSVHSTVYRGDCFGESDETLE